MVGMILVVCYLIRNLIKNRKDWLTRFLLLLALFVVTPILNSTFSLLSNTNYHRWYFMLILMLGLASARVMESHRDYPIKTISVLFIFFTIGIAGLSYWWDQNKFALIYDSRMYDIIFTIGLAGAVFTFLIHACLKNEKYYFYGMLGMVGVFSVLTNMLCCQGYKAYANGKAGNEYAKLYYDRMMALQQIDIQDDAYRFDSADNIMNMADSYRGTGSFISTVNGSIFQLYDALGGVRKVFTPVGPEGTDQLLSAKYYVSGEKKAGALQTIESGDYVGYVYEKEGIPPIGFTFDSYLLRSEFEEIPSTNRAKAMLRTLVVPNEKEALVKNQLFHDNVSDVLEAIERKDERNYESSENIEINKSTLLASMEAEKDEYAFFSIPYDTGWHASVNGSKVEIININGLMAIPITQGSNQIVFTYHNIYFYIGIVMSVIGILLWIAYRKGILISYKLGIRSKR